jgi:hypothetical protein
MDVVAGLGCDIGVVRSAVRGALKKHFLAPFGRAEAELHLTISHEL